MGAAVNGTNGFAECCPRCGFGYSTPPAQRSDFDAIRDDDAFPMYSLSREEVERRMPALSLIEDREVRQATLDITGVAPPYFWIVPASTSGYHHPLCQETRGLWAHTLMVVGAYQRLVDSYEERGLITHAERDLGLAACILHDQRKEGEPLRPKGSSTSDHDLKMADVVRDRMGDRVADAIASHMGPWYDGPAPGTPLQDLVHNADMMASTANVTVKVPGPVPEELASLGVEEEVLRS